MATRSARSARSAQTPQPPQPPQPAQSATPARSQSRWRHFYAVVERIPPGRVATYGQVAALAGYAANARQVGYALAALPEESGLPWQRVINARGEVSLRREPGREGFQRHLLEEEGVRFGPLGRVDLARFGWEPGAKPTGRRVRTSRQRKGG